MKREKIFFMDTSEFDFNLPNDLIASTPSIKRGDDRLMLLSVQSKDIVHYQFHDIINIIPSNALLVFNDSRVRKARLKALSESGSMVEFLLLRPVSDDVWIVLVNKSKRQKIGQRYTLTDNVSAIIVDDGEYKGSKLIRFNGLTEHYIETHGSIPLPPYMHRLAQDLDEERYQTVYAKHLGSAAAPTAGLHFTNEILDSMRSRGIQIAFVTLHVGLGTFAPIHSEDITNHVMHTEYCYISPECAHQINKARKEQRPIIAVGTTSCRLLESAASNNPEYDIAAGEFKSSIFIYPGYNFKLVTGLLTNFHTPKSTLLALVSALAGLDLIKESYSVAIKQRYKFFSYGDAMLILP